jgi:cell surface hyaluronidase
MYRRIVAIVALVVAASFCVVIVLRTSAVERWSDPNTWNGSVPVAGGRVVIPWGKTVVLDTSPPRLTSLVIRGRLIVADRNVRLECGEIDLRGELRIGDERAPFLHNATVVLDSSAPGRGIIRVQDGGKLMLWGDVTRTWTHLAQTALPERRDLVLSDDTFWRPGDSIVVAPSGFSASEAEEDTVASIDGRALTLARPLRFRHWGTITDGVDERAEVGLLSHNVIVTSDESGAARGAGGQVLVTSGGHLDVHGVEFMHLGVRGKLGEYPIHFHLAGDARGSVVASSSVVHDFNRCITIHGTSGVVISDNVAFDTVGHCVFMEDGIETNNVIVGNLVLLARAAKPSEAILDSDLQPADFWITNPSNTVTENVAAGSEGNGFWYDLSPHPTGPSATESVWPRRMALDAFANNVAHSNANDGLFVDILHNPPGVTEAPNYDPPDAAVFAGFTAYKNRRRGGWLRGENLRLRSAVIADNSIGVTFAGGDDVLLDSLVVGTTENDTGPPKPFEPHFPIRGFEFYDGQVGVERTTFRNFVPSTVRRASALSFLRFSPFFADPSNYARTLSFENAVPLYFEPRSAALDRLGGDGYRGNVFLDVDGSVSGVTGASIAIDTPVLSISGCDPRPQWRALVCNRHFGSMFIVAVGVGQTSPGPVRVSNAPGRDIVLYGNPTPSSDKIFQTNVAANGRYVVTFARRLPDHVRLGFHRFDANARLTVELPQEPPAKRFLPIHVDGQGDAVVDVTT